MSFCAKIVVSKEIACTIGKLKSRAFDRCVGSSAANGCQEKKKEELLDPSPMPI
jgi:hypothetical protein